MVSISARTRSPARGRLRFSAADRGVSRSCPSTADTLSADTAGWRAKPASIAGARCPGDPYDEAIETACQGSGCRVEAVVRGGALRCRAAPERRARVDAQRFDAFARSLQVTRNRRGALGAILAAMSGLALKPEPVGARKRRRRQPGARCVDCSDRSLTRSADLKGCDLSQRDLSGADLRSTDLAGACLQHADLTGADLRRPTWRGRTSPARI